MTNIYFPDEKTKELESYKVIETIQYFKNLLNVLAAIDRANGHLVSVSVSNTVSGVMRDKYVITYSITETNEQKLSYEELT